MGLCVWQDMCMETWYAYVHTHTSKCCLAYGHEVFRNQLNIVWKLFGDLENLQGLWSFEFEMSMAWFSGRGSSCCIDVLVREYSYSFETAVDADDCASSIIKWPGLYDQMVYFHHLIIIIIINVNCRALDSHVFCQYNILRYWGKDTASFSNWRECPKLVDIFPQELKREGFVEDLPHKCRMKLRKGESV